MLEHVEQSLAAGAFGLVGKGLVNPKLLKHERPVSVVGAENPRIVSIGSDTFGDLLADMPLILGAEDIGTLLTGLQLDLMLDQRNVDRLGNLEFTVDLVRQLGVNVAEANAL